MLAVALVALFAIGVVAAADTKGGHLGIGDALVLGVVEGVTEYLPVSSTGHLTVTEKLLGLSDDAAGKEAADAYAIVIQFGAILAVLVLYRRRITTMLAAVVGRSRDPSGRRLAIALVVAFLPAAVVGFALGDTIKAHLFGVWPIVAAWAVGGVAILALAGYGVRATQAGHGVRATQAGRLTGGSRPLEDIRLGEAALVGCAQVLALWPGVSRSLVTILAALAIGLTMRAAIEFSFLLGLLTLGAATLYEAASKGSVIVDRFGLAIPLIGLVTALVAAVVAVRQLVEYLDRHPLTIFAWYRLGIAAVVGALALTPAL